MKRGLLIYNPTAGQRDRRGQMSGLIDTMRSQGMELVNAPTEGPGHATEIVRTFLPRGLDVVAACGGDGTISEVACGLAGSPVPLAILPGGTTNVLVRELEIPLELSDASRLLLRGVPRQLRLLLANDRPFLLWTGVGLDARIMGNTNMWLKRWLGRAGIFVTVTREFFRYEFPRLEVTIDGVVYEATFAVVSHVRHYGGNWIITPEASPESREMDVLLFQGRGRYAFFRLFREMQLGRAGHLREGIARVVRGRVVTLRSLESYAVETQVDGDRVLETPVTCRAAEQMVSVLVPGEPGYFRPA
jgi:YegS/Rv2252/BmrU family lipid kinase